MSLTIPRHRSWLDPRTLLAITLALSAFAPARSYAQTRDDPWLGRDKALHAGVSFALAAGGYAASAPWIRPRPARAACGVALSLSLGAAKELYDLAGHGTPSGRDFTWNVVGALGGVGVAALLDFAWSRLRGRTREASAPASGRRLALSWR